MREELKYKCKCGKERPYYMMICDECSEKLRFEKAKKINIEDYEGSFVYDIQTDEYFQDIDDLEEHYESENMELPDYVYGCEAIEFSLDMSSIVRNELNDNHFEGAEERIDVESLKSLQNIVDAWTSSQGITSYERDYSLVLLLNK